MTGGAKVRSSWKAECAAKVFLASTPTVFLPCLYVDASRRRIICGCLEKAY